MTASRSYLNSMAGGARGSTQPVLRAPSVPVWPVRALGADAFTDTFPLAVAPPPRTREGEMAEPQAILQNPAQPMADAFSESISVDPPASAGIERSTSTRREQRVEPSTNTARMSQENQEQLEPVPMAPLQTGAFHRKDSAATVKSSSQASATDLMPGSGKTQTKQRRPSHSSGGPENGTDRPDQITPPQSAATHLQSQMEPPRIAEREKAGPLTASTARFAYSREQANSIHIGKIDIHIAPPPAHVAQRRITRQMPANSGAALARGFLSSFGLRQG